MSARGILTATASSVDDASVPSAGRRRLLLRLLVLTGAAVAAILLAPGSAFASNGDHGNRSLSSGLTSSLGHGAGDATAPVTAAVTAPVLGTVTDHASTRAVQRSVVQAARHATAVVPAESPDTSTVTPVVKAATAPVAPAVKVVKAVTAPVAPVVKAATAPVAPVVKAATAPVAPAVKVVKAVTAPVAPVVKAVTDDVAAVRATVETEPASSAQHGESSTLVGHSTTTVPRIHAVAKVDQGDRRRAVEAAGTRAVQDSQTVVTQVRTASPLAHAPVTSAPDAPARDPLQLPELPTAPAQGPAAQAGSGHPAGEFAVLTTTAPAATSSHHRPDARDAVVPRSRATAVDTRPA